MVSRVARAGAGKTRDEPATRKQPPATNHGAERDGARGAMGTQDLTGAVDPA